MNQSPSKLRIFLFQLLTLVLITKAVAGAWFPESSDHQTLTNNLSEADTILTPSLEERTLLLQLKIALGSLYYLKEKSKDYTAGSFPLQSFEETLKKSFEQGALSEQFKKEQFEDSDLQLFIKKYAFARFLKIESAQKKYQELTDKINTNRPYLKLAKLVISALENKEQIKLSAEDKQLLSHLDIFSKLLIKDIERSNEIKKELEDFASKFFKKFVIALLTSTVFIFLSIFCFIIYTYKIFAKRFKSSINLKKSDTHFALEIFCIYLGTMLFMPKVIEFLQQRGFFQNGLQANILTITPLILLIFWPILFGISFKKVRETLGIQFVSLKRTINDLFIGPTAYLAYWVLLFIVLVIYSLVMTKLGVNTENSAHPVVPVLAETKDKINIFYIFILAVVVAPLIEEIMFRGALYSWLRSRFSIAFSIISSSFIFAAIHPQGAVGVVPLMCIGILLALLREWRGGLLTPILAHACFNAGTLSMVLFIFRG